MFVNPSRQELWQNYNNYNETAKSISPPQIRKKIQNYSFILTDQIGKGYSSTVYKGINDLTGEQIAIKVIELKSLRDQTSKHMLNTEIQCFKEMKHPHLLRYQNSYFTVNNCYIVTEYCSKGDLSKLIREKRRFSEEEAARYFYQIYSGYYHFHQAGYIHRDLKPANIFVSELGQLKIADFGFCKRKTLVEKECYNVGTPIYMPKESLTANIYNEKTDVWALGITLYEMVFGEVPFKGKNEAELKAEIEKGIVYFPNTATISAQLKDFIMNCLLNDSFRRISIRDMSKHPWLRAVILALQSREIVNKGLQENNNIMNITNPAKQVHINQRYSEPNECGHLKKNESVDKDNRISLPNQIINHNRSKGYFQSLADSKQNRRSISSMQRLKLCQPKKASQVIDSGRQSFITRSSNITEANAKQLKQQQKNNQDQQQNKQNVSNNNTSGSASVATHQLKIKIQKPVNSSKSIGSQSNRIQKVVSLINYFRLLYKIFQKVQLAYNLIFDAEVKNLLNTLLQKFAAQIKTIFTMHTSNIEAKTNCFNLNNQFWQSFINSDRWKMYSFVISKYKNKYSSLLDAIPDQSVSYSGQSEAWITYFIQFFDKYSQFEDVRLALIKQKYVFAELLYLIQHFITLRSVIESRGWQFFSDNYGDCEEILQDKLAITIGNYFEVNHRIHNTYQDFKRKVTQNV